MSTRQAPVFDSELSHYTRTAQRSSARVIREYSSSFGLATRLFASEHRAEVESIYGLVRIADEIVDGAAAQAGLDLDEQQALLDALEADTNRAVACGYSANVVVHAFAVTARDVGIGPELTTPFFSSMRRDLSTGPFTPAELRDYIYGSAEVVGLMCLRAFLADEAVSPEERAFLEHGARRLGAAFQKINFLRDLATDWVVLGRSYFPGIDPESLDDDQKSGLLDDIDADLDAAAPAISRLPGGCRRPVAAAYALFRALADELRRTPADSLIRTRVRISSPRKLAIVARATIGGVST